MFVTMAVIDVVIRDFGPDAQAGFGVGQRLMQAIFLPAMALAFAVAPVAGQNFGAQLHDRVRETFRSAAIMSTVLMTVLTLLCHWRPELLVSGFATDPGVVAVGTDFLRTISWSFVASGTGTTRSLATFGGERGIAGYPESVAREDRDAPEIVQTRTFRQRRLRRCTDK